MKIAENVTDLIGNTPLVRLNGPSEKTGANILGKCEFMNPTSSVKDRIGFNMVKSAIEEGAINKDVTIIEPTSGNTGIALASVCAAMKIKLILTMPDSMSVERRNILNALGAELVLTPAASGMKGSIAKAQALQEEIPGAIILHQFRNAANPAVHRRTTAEEIFSDTDGMVDIFVAAVGTGGTLTGTGSRLRELKSAIDLVAVEPEDSPILSGGQPGPHKIQGIGAGFVPDVLDVELYGEVITVSNEEAIQTSRTLAREEGLLVGISAGANVFAAMQVGMRTENRGKTIVTILCDTAERYLSTSLFE